MIQQIFQLCLVVGISCSAIQEESYGCLQYYNVQESNPITATSFFQMNDKSQNVVQAGNYSNLHLDEVELLIVEGEGNMDKNGTIWICIICEHREDPDDDIYTYLEDPSLDSPDCSPRELAVDELLMKYNVR